MTIIMFAVSERKANITHKNNRIGVKADGVEVNQGYVKNHPSQQLFKVFILYFAATCFDPRWPSSGGIHNYFREVISLQRIRCFPLYSA
jgi:hypothetical protein